MSKSNDKNLNEANGKGIVFSFGRFNPPHKGHELLVNKLVSTAKKLGYENALYASSSHEKDISRNPLNYRNKINFLEKAFKKANVVDDSSIKNPYHVCKHLSDNGYENVVLVVGGDRTRDLERGIRKYIGHKDPKLAYNFKTFEVVSAGKRDADSDDVSGMSASKMRQAAMDSNYSVFKDGCPSDMGSRDIKKMYDLVRKGLGANESIQFFLDSMDVDTPEEVLVYEAMKRLDHETLVDVELVEQDEDSMPTFIVLTKFDDEDDFSSTTQKIEKACDKLGASFYAISIDDAYIVDKDIDDNELTIHNYNGEGMKLNLKTDNVVCIPRGTVLSHQSGVGLMSVLQDSGIFVVNKLSNMELCQNKYATAIALERANVDSPKTALIANEEAVDVALDKIGGEFPVVLKTITGAEGIGVSLIDSRESLLGVLQSLWKFDAEMIIQEYFKIDFDVRTIVVDGKIVASAKRIKGDKDFRTNKSLGNDTEPYNLSEEEKSLVLKAANTCGCYWCGVDHMVVDHEEYKVLEVNGSPGSEAEPFTGYFKGEEEEVSGQEMINHVVTHLSDQDNWRFSPTEIGAIEEVEIDGIGSMDARIDTGNESYNSLHADSHDYDEDSGMVEFKTMGKELKLPVVSSVRIHIGSGRQEERPVVKMDMIMGGKRYKNVRFSLSDREENEHPLLIGMKFLDKYNFTVNVSKNYELREYVETINKEFDILLNT